ncbi:MAG: 50S ribosomal protein L5 [Flavobacteriales bacterium]
MKYTPRLRSRYSDEIAPKLKTRFEYTSIMQVPKITKICLNQGLGKATADKKIIDAAIDELTMIAGQKASATKATKDISNFKLRKGVAIGAKVTLRGDKMYDFLDRLIAVALPRTRDFRGVKASGFDGRGNFTFGVKEQIIFPEIDLDKIKQINGMDITFVTTAHTNEEAKALLEEFGFPFTK